MAAVFLVLLSSAGWFAYQSVQSDRRRHEADRRAKLATYQPAILEVLPRIQTGHLSLKRLSTEPMGLPWLFKRTAGPITRDEFRDLFASKALPRLQEAVTRLIAIVEGLPEKADAHYLLAKAYVLLERRDRAKEEVDHALGCDPAFVPARVLSMELQTRGATGARHARLVQSEQFARIEAEYEGCEDWERWWLLAYKSFRTKHWDEMADAYHELIGVSRRKEPYVGCLVEAYLGRGVAHLQRGDFPAAQEDFSAVRSHAPGLESGLLLARAHYPDESPGHRERAEAILRELYCDAGPEEKNETAFWMAAVCRMASEHDQALAWINKLDGFPLQDRLESYYLWRAGRTAEAINAGRRATARDAEDPVAHLLLASALLSDLQVRPEGEDGRLAELLEAAGKASRLAPESALARSLIEAGEDLQRQRREERNGTVNNKKILWVPALAALIAGTGLAQAGLVGGYFDDVKLLPAYLNQGWVVDPTVTADELELYFARTFDGKSWQLCVTRRASTDENWASPEVLTELGTPGGGLFVMPDGRTLYFNRSGQLYVATRDVRGDPYPALRVPFGAPRPLTAIINTGSLETFPSLTADGRELWHLWSV